MTGLFNAILACGGARGLHTALDSAKTRPCDLRRDSGVSGTTLNDPSYLTTEIQDKSDVSTIETHTPTRVGSNIVTGTSASEQDTRATSSWHSTLFTIIELNPVFAFSLAMIIVVAIPVACATRDRTSLDIFTLIFLWTGTLAAQTWIRRNGSFHIRSANLQVFAATTSNPVVWTSLGTIAYLYLWTVSTGSNINATLASFQVNLTIADLIRGEKSASQYVFEFEHRHVSPIGAGDLAISLLNAGIVSWGFKLFECRTQLLSRAGLITIIVATLAAIINVVCWPLLVHATGLRPAARCIAFAARGVTIALASPAMDRLGGDQGLNAAMVVLSGVLFQLGWGVGLGTWLDGLLSRVKSRTMGPQRCCQDDPEKGRHHGDAQTASSAQAETAPAPHEPRTVAEGIAVGINAAAMGTAYLNEQGSDSASYSALSMTVFGAMTVAFSFITPLATWLRLQVS